MHLSRVHLFARRPRLLLRRLEGLPPSPSSFPGQASASFLPERSKVLSLELLFHAFSFQALAHSFIFRVQQPLCFALIIGHDLQVLSFHAPDKTAPRLYSPLRRIPLARSRQEYPADSQRLVSNRESPRRQPRLPGLDARISGLRTQNPRAPCRDEQLRTVDCLVSRRHSHSAFLWNLYSRCAGRRRSDRHFQRLDHAEEQRRSGPRQGRSEKSESERYLSQRVLSANAAAHCRPRIDFHGYHPRGERASPPWPELPRDSRRSDRFGPHGAEHLYLLWLRRSSRRYHRRKRYEHHSAALFLPPRLHRRPDFLERRKRLASFSARSRGLRLPCGAWCNMEFHHRDETRSPEFHRVPQLCGRIVPERRCLASGGGRAHDDRRPGLPRLRLTIRDSQWRADSPPREPRQRQTRDGLTFRRGMDALERSSRLLRAGVFRLGSPAHSQGFCRPSCFRGRLREGAPHGTRRFARCKSDCLSGFRRERSRRLCAHASIPERSRGYRGFAEPAGPLRI